MNIYALKNIENYFYGCQKFVLLVVGGIHSLVFVPSNLHPRESRAFFLQKHSVILNGTRHLHAGVH